MNCDLSLTALLSLCHVDRTDQTRPDSEQHRTLKLLTPNQHQTHIVDCVIEWGDGKNRLITVVNILYKKKIVMYKHALLTMVVLLIRSKLLCGALTH